MSHRLNELWTMRRCGVRVFSKITGRFTGKFFELERKSLNSAQNLQILISEQGITGSISNFLPS
jgi:hypothetical protein